MHMIWFLSALRLFDVKVFVSVHYSRKKSYFQVWTSQQSFPYSERDSGIAAEQFSSPFFST